MRQFLYLLSASGASKPNFSAIAFQLFNLIYSFLQSFENLSYIQLHPYLCTSSINTLLLWRPCWLWGRVEFWVVLMHHWTAWIASIVSMRQSSFHQLVHDRPGLRPIARIEHGRSKRSRSPQSPQALTIVYVMFSHNRPNRMITYELTAAIETIAAIIWEPAF